ncbi:MAG: hypothetical protein ACOCZ5_01655 [bacterium]
MSESNESKDSKDINNAIDPKIKTKAEIQGIESIKDSLRKVIKLGMTIKKALEDDGKISFFEAVGMLQPLFEMRSIIRDFDMIKAEHDDLSSDEREYIINYFNKEFNLSNKHLEHIIESAFEAMVAIDKFIAKF